MSLSKEEMEMLIEGHPGLSGVKYAKMAGVSLRTWETYKSKYGMTNKVKPKEKNLKLEIFDTLSDSVLQVDKLAQKYKLKDKFEIYKTIEEIEKEGYIVEKKGSGYFINKRPTAQDLKTTFYGEHFKLGIVSDTHLCSTAQQLTHLNSMYDIYEKEGVTQVLHSGDILDGENVYGKLHQYEVFKVGADAQIDYAIKNYPKRKSIKTFVIAGNHDLDYMKLAGIDAVKRISNERDDIGYLGQLGAYINLNNKVPIYLIHPDGGGSYAISYKPQRIIEKMSSENKPKICIIGHYHQAEYFFLRNTHVMQGGCFASQTNFLKRKGIEPQIGGWIVDINVSKDGSVTRFKPEFIPFFKPVFNDY